jgi:hypothetical protein
VVRELSALRNRKANGDPVLWATALDGHRGGGQGPVRKTPLKRGKPLKRKTQIKRGSWTILRTVTARFFRIAKGRSRFPKRRQPEFMEWFRAKRFRCGVWLCTRPADPAHVRSRGAGGHDKGNVSRLCRWHHQFQEQHGWARVKEEYDFDGPADAGEVERIYEKEMAP